MSNFTDVLAPAPAPAELDVTTEDVVEAYSFSTGVPLAPGSLTLCFVVLGSPLSHSVTSVIRRGDVPRACLHRACLKSLFLLAVQPLLLSLRSCLVWAWVVVCGLVSNPGAVLLATQVPGLEEA